MLRMPYAASGEKRQTVIICHYNFSFALESGIRILQPSVCVYRDVGELTYCFLSLHRNDT